MEYGNLENRDLVEIDGYNLVTNSRTDKVGRGVGISSSNTLIVNI